MNTLYQIFIYPLEVGMEWVFGHAYVMTDHYGAALILLSLCVNLALLPLYHLAESWQQAERGIQKRLAPKLEEFKQVFSGEERFMMIRTLYRQHGYHPIYALRTTLGLAIQVPFFIAAYHLLSHYSGFDHASFFLFENLAKPDGLLWGINVMPFVMTGVNFLSAFVYAKHLNFNDKIQLGVISLVFLALLYAAPVALVLYWTFNNIFSLAKNLVYYQIAPINRSKFWKDEEMVSPHPKSGKSFSGFAIGPFKIERNSARKIKQIFQSPFALAFFVGVFPVLFFVSNNWFMFDASRLMVAFGTFSLGVFLMLSGYYIALNWSFKKMLSGNQAKNIQRLFVLVAVLVLAYQLRISILPLVDNSYSKFLMIVMFMAVIVAWLLPKIQMYRMNIVLGVMCLAPLGSIMDAIYAKETKTLVDWIGYDSHRKQYDHIAFSKRPNVYYIVPDGYPNKEALGKIFHIDDFEFYRQLESWGFQVEHEMLSNYQHTTSSISSAFGMGHHYYKGSIGNSELLDSREFIVSNQNPVVRIFENNGYKIDYIHAEDSLLTKGCYVDSCFPNATMDELIDVWIPSKVQSWPILAGLTNNSFRFKQKFLKYIDEVSVQSSPHFTYVHMSVPGHSYSSKQAYGDLVSFRENYDKKISLANEEITSFVERILAHDPHSLIIINADHGAWGYGSYKHVQNEVLDGIEDNLIALDHLGVLFAIRWPDGELSNKQNFRTNVNIFRQVFSVLSDREGSLASNIPDHGFITNGEVVMEVVHEGKILDHMVKMGES